jgi:hypothetical protein
MQEPEGLLFYLMNLYSELNLNGGVQKFKAEGCFRAFKV